MVSMAAIPFPPTPYRQALLPTIASWWQLSLDIMNVGNLFNSKWGVAKNMGSCNNGQVLKVNKVENNTPVFSMMKVNGEYATKTWNFNHNYDQCWKMQIGIKYTFN